MKKRFLIYFLLVVMLIQLSFISADLLSAVISPTTGEVDQYQNYTIVVNNTNNPSGINFTQVNISAPVGVSVADVGTNTLNESFIVDGQVISWSNSSGLIFNGTTGDFWVNASMNHTGVFNVTVITLDTSSNTNSTNLTVTISDTTAPLIDFISPTPANNSNLNQSYIPVNVTASDNVEVSNVSVALYDHSGAVINVSNSTSSLFFVNFTGLSNGNYSISATANDTSGNLNHTEIRYIILNLTNVSTAPVVSCTENWTCGDWSACNNGTQTRVCTDQNSCNTTINEPALSQSCTMPESACNPIWDCGNWTPDPCTADQTQTQICVDISNCSNPSKTNTRRCPSVAQSSSPASSQSGKNAKSSTTIFTVIVGFIILSVIIVSIVLIRLKNSPHSSDDFGDGYTSRESGPSSPKGSSRLFY